MLLCIERNDVLSCHDSVSASNRNGLATLGQSFTEREERSRPLEHFHIFTIRRSDIAGFKPAGNRDFESVGSSRKPLISLNRDDGRVDYRYIASMRTLTLPFLLSLLVLGNPCGQAQSEPIDFQRARQLNERRQRGETLTAEETAQLQRALAQRRDGSGRAAGGGGADLDWDKARALFQRRQRGEQLAPEERAYLERAIAARNANSPGAGNQRKAPERLVPLCDMSVSDRYEGEDGGLYGGGRNVPPEAHRKAAEAQIAHIRPLNADGERDENGVIGFVAISMSNATQEFARFKQEADRSPRKSAKVVIVDCAQGGQAMAEWVPATGGPWQEAKRRLAAAKVSLLQVQVAWIKLANKGPAGSLIEHGHKLEADTLAVLHNARTLFPNLRIVYLGSRTYGGYATSSLNPEPYAYEGAFAARWLIQRQIKGDPELAEGKSPLLLWGPYLWAEGAKGRKLDKLVWERVDFGGDGVHPSDSGRQKVAGLLLDFLAGDPLAKPWFARASN